MVVLYLKMCIIYITEMATKPSFVLPNYEYAIHDLQQVVMYAFHMQNQILKLFPPTEVFHRGSYRLVSTPNVLERAPECHKVKFKLDPAMFCQTNVVEFTNVTFKVSSELLNQLLVQTIGVMLDTADAAGNKVDGKGRNVWELYIEALQRLEYREEGYKCFVGSDVMERMLASPPTEEQLARAKAVMRHKREQYLSNKRSRRLH
jgi:hypothetical protein